MAWKFEELEEMSISALKDAYDKRYMGKIESREFILNEISRRHSNEQTNKIVELTRTVKNLTWAILGLTVLNLVTVLLSVFFNSH